MGWWATLSVEPRSEPLDPTRVFEVLKDTLGEGWVCDRAAHICLLSRNSDPEGSSVTRSLFELLTTHLNLRHVSVASGGFEAVAACARKEGMEIINNEEPARAAAPFKIRTPRLGSEAPPASPRDDDVDSVASTVSGEPGDNRWSLRLSSAWSTIRKAAAGTSAAAGKPETDSAAATDTSTRRDEDSSATTDSVHVESRIPGNWPADADLSVLPRKPLHKLTERHHWYCLAVSVKCPEAVSATTSPGTPGEGCNCIIAFVGSTVVCARVDEGEGTVLAECEITQVLRVTAKKHTPDVLIFYFRDDVGEPSMVLCFTSGARDVEAFIEVLRGQYKQRREGGASLGSS